MVPGLVVIDPCDATEIGQATAAIADHRGPVYMRLLRGKVPVVFDPETYRFEIGKAKRLRAGKVVGIISTGLMTERALDAAAMLARRGIDAGVLHVATIKPFDADAVAEFASSVDRVVTAENHVTSGGLASLVAEALFDRAILKPLQRIGLPDRYIECGSVPHLQAVYGLTADRVAEAIAAMA
jgi:transketolase